MHGAAGGQVLGQGPPLTARAQDVEHCVEHLAHINPALPPRPAVRDVYEGAGQVPFGVGHVTRITQALAVVGTASLGLPHRRSSSTATPTRESQPTRPTQLSPGPALSSPRTGHLSGDPVQLARLDPADVLPESAWSRPRPY